MPSVDDLDWRSFVAGAVTPLLLWAGVRLTKTAIEAAAARIDDRPHAQGLKVSGLRTAPAAPPGPPAAAAAGWLCRQATQLPLSNSFPNLLLQVVITGSTRGLGLHLAKQFLCLGDDVVISGRK